ncbi:MAG: aconitase X catalytic domain-containing protein [Archaeoglobaceae archaeon]
MYLTREEEKLLESNNPTIAKSMEILVALGEIYEAEELTDISSAHISGISYQNIGDAGLEWLEDLDSEFKVKTTTNPAGMDFLRWQEMGIEREFCEKQKKIIRALENIGAKPVMTCTPYYLEEISYGEHLAWAESSAIIYANSVIGARTNRESGISAIASGIIGKTSYYGLHIKERRAPNVLIDLKGDIDPSVAGYRIGSSLKNEIPLLRVNRELKTDELKLLGAAMAATGNAAIYHIEGQTPEWDDFETPQERLELDVDDMKELKGFECDPDLVALGCPHLSLDELKKVLKALETAGKVKRDLWIFTSRKVAEQNAEVVDRIESYGAEVFSDTCMVVSPSTERYRCVMVNSGKALTYLPKLRKVDVAFGNLEECINRAVT